jgi:signal transduction histidine kinase
MSTKADDDNQLSTDKISDEDRGQPTAPPILTYRPVPDSDAPWGTTSPPVWRVRFELASDPGVRFGLDINGEVMLGRGSEGSNLVDLSPYEAEKMGVSRHHIKLRPESTKLYVLDLDSTNGTQRNGRSIGINTPYSISDGDSLMLGRLQLFVHIVKRPPGQFELLRDQADSVEALAELAKAITSHLALDEVLHQSLDVAMSLTEAGEAAVWLVDEQTNELFLEAERGIDDESIKRLRLPVTDTLAGEVVRTGKPLRASREPDGDPVKIKTGYLVEALLYAPLTLGGATFGVLAAAHRVPNREFTEHSESLVATIADFTAIAVQNARVHEATDKALAQRVQELAALNELSRAVTSTLDLDAIHETLVEQVNKRWDVEAVALWLVDEETGKVNPYISAEEDSDDISHRAFKLGEGLVGKVAQDGRPKAYHEQAEDAGRILDATVKMRGKSIACVPLKVKARVVGVLALINKRKGLFSDAELVQLQGFAHPMATAIENAQLYAELDHERAIIDATANSLGQPLMIVGHRGEQILVNETANALLDTILSSEGRAESVDATGPLDQLVRGLSHGLGRTTEIAVDDRHYLATVKNAPEVGTITVMQDITHRKKLEQAQAEFVDALSHDMRTPLSSIKVFAQLLEKTESLHEQGANAVHRIVHASNRMLSLVDQLLDMALLDSTPPKHEPCDLAREVAAALHDLEGAALAQSIELDFELVGKPYQITGNCRQLYRCMLNLGSNAIKFSPEKGKISTRVTFDEKGVTLDVRDEGPGIKDSELPHIFEKYYRGKQERREQLGIGLGLAMVRSTAEAHGGKVSARNVKGGGAELTITLPASLRVA